MNFAPLFREQVRWCNELGSPFTAALLARCADDIEADGPIARLVAGRDWTPSDALPLRVAGAFHKAALEDGEFGALYPSARRDWRMEEIWPAALKSLEARGAEFAEVLRFAPQTNETRRSIALLPAFLACGSGPLHMLELGASAGLNVLWDQFRFRTDAWRWGEGAGPVIDTQWRGRAPAYLGPLQVASRAACDLNPMDVRDDTQRTRLKAFIWADQPERFARFDAAANLAIAMDTRVARADAADWVAARLTGALPTGVTVLYHSIVWQYFPELTKARITRAIEAAAARADAAHRLAWVRYEFNSVLGIAEEGYSVELIAWPGGEKRLIARADPHVRWVEMV